MTVDTLSFARELRDAELSQTQADAIAAAIGRSVQEGSATKADVQLLRSDLERFRSDLDVDIQKVRSTLIMWVVGANLTFAALIIAASKF